MRLRALLPAVALTLLATACASFERESPRSVDDGAVGGNETIIGHVTPQGELKADTLDGFQPDTAQVERETVLTGTFRTTPAHARDADPAPARLATGWRVQVFASRDRSQAEAFVGRLEGRMDGAPVYVEHADSWFKVRVGDFPDREAAERLRSRLVDRGFDDAWTVRTTIRTVP